MSHCSQALTETPLENKNDTVNVNIKRQLPVLHLPIIIIIIIMRRTHA
jgi:hypothetical protein